MVGTLAFAAVAAFCAAMCAAVPFAADRLMRAKRDAHKAWFGHGMHAYEIGAKDGLLWARALPRLIEDRAISREGARDALGLGVADLPSTIFLPAEVELDERFTFSGRRAKIAAAGLATIGFAIGLALPILGAALLQTAIIGAVAAACTLLALVDMRCRMIPNLTVAALCSLGICLRIACGSGVAEAVALLVIAALIVGTMYAADAIYAHAHAGHRAIGDGDKKVMAAIVFCSGLNGIALAFITLPSALLLALIVQPMCRSHHAKRAFGPYAAFAITIGSLASILF